VPLEEPQILTPKDSHIECPDCGAEIPIPENVVVGEILTCKDCGLEIETKKDGEFEIFFFEGEDHGE